MLKNVSSEPVVLRWGGETVTLGPGQVCRYKDDRVELRQKGKHGKALEHTPEPKSAAETKSHIQGSVSSPEPQAQDVPVVGTKDQPAETSDVLGCSVCAFVAKSPQGLDTHIRSKHAS